MGYVRNQIQQFHRLVAWIARPVEEARTHHAVNAMPATALIPSDSIKIHPRQSLITAPQTRSIELVPRKVHSNIGGRARQPSMPQ
eukprot:1683265-Pyramimonas_sp.AAC.1